ncbi:D-alanyl-D-alanine carboxypeptidase [Streptomyces sp. RB5]|uniref:D-alanyl-D-alanine carboxypeptidase n=1 Tax=Streptomyces smaragdinus TaxID=2585196 RepID=A0A7K0CCZ8_9ACTN|nr:serine hydrolase domain-containing protein [Streptomyces smaragdinus]MQY11347.1 D-alanyl-D-alanine carboxypeptidase [Streptomyces smaragdinus]
MSKPLPLVALLCALTLAAPAPAAAATNDLQHRLNALVNADGGPPGVIVVLRSGDHTRVLRAGTADLAHHRPIDPADHTRVASTAKAFSGAVALSLVRRGRLGLDDTIGDRLPRLPAAWHAVTLRRLLQHTSGLPDYSEDEAFRDLLRADPHHVFDPRRLLDFVADKPLNFAPGSTYRYSNSDNIAVALMAEQATGRTYDALLRREVYGPLRLHETSLPLGYEMPEPYMRGYAMDPPNPPEDVSELFGASGLWASGGIVSTPRDLTRFIRGYASGALTSKDALSQQRHWIRGSSEPAGPGENRVGLAIFRYRTRCGTVLGHTGNTAGYTQLMAATPDGSRSLTFTITTQVNRDTPPGLLKQLRAAEEDAVCALLAKGKH